jgi:hypothetical protein
MHIEDATARRFIRHYQDFLLSIAGPQANRSKNVLQVLAEARARYATERGLFAAWRAENGERDADMLDAIERMEIGRWIYLKDTRSYSVFLRDDGKAAYAVQGLTNRLRAIHGYSGIVLQAGIFPLGGQFVCDGIFADVMILGPNYMADFRDRYQVLRESGCFYAESGGSK